MLRSRVAGPVSLARSPNSSRSGRERSDRGFPGVEGNSHVPLSVSLIFFALAGLRMNRCTNGDTEKFEAERSSVYGAEPAAAPSGPAVWIG